VANASEKGSRLCCKPECGEVFLLGFFAKFGAHCRANS
jgi:hypothetical protein